MQIQLEQITFNLDPASPKNDKLSPHLDTTRGLEFSELIGIEDFVLAYVSTEQISPEIKVRFSSKNLSSPRIEIQGVATEDNVLGDVPNQWVDFDDSERPVEATFSLPKSKLQSGVQCNTIAWEWQYRTTEHQSWTSFKTTRHRLYCTFAPPTEPWKTEQPWPAVLEYACKWAKGAKDEPTAATRITEAVFDLGRQRKVTYIRSATYANEKFECASFLKLLKNGIGIAQRVNCDDCATIVSTFGNILGCDLNQSSMGEFFQTNYIYLIGDSDWSATGFPRHSVAWKDKCGKNDPLYDACLQIDIDKKPSLKGHEAQLPANLKFGTGSSQANDYKFCLVSSGNCYPMPKLTKRRGLGKSYFGERRFTDEEYLSVVKDRYEFNNWHNDTKNALAVPKLSFIEFIGVHPAFGGWEKAQVDHFTDADLDSVDRLTLFWPDKSPTRMVEVSIYICSGHTNPNDFLLQLLAQFTSTDIQRGESGLSNAIVFFERDQSMHLVKYHHLIGLVRSIGGSPLSTTRMRMALEDVFYLLATGGVLSSTASIKKTTKLTTGGFNMSHKFSYPWHSYVAGEDGLVQVGFMDLTSMDDSGHLENGWYYLPDGTRRQLSGQVLGGAPYYYLSLREQWTVGDISYTNYYDGVLAHESVDGRNLIIVGKLHYGSVHKEQIDPPWVISKP